MPPYYTTYSADLLGLGLVVYELELLAHPISYSPPTPLLLSYDLYKYCAVLPTHKTTTSMLRRALQLYELQAERTMRLYCCTYVLRRTRESSTQGGRPALHCALHCTVW